MGRGRPAQPVFAPPPSLPFQPDLFSPTPDQIPIDLHSLAHTSSLVLCPACKFITQTRVEPSVPSNPRLWPFDTCYSRAPCHTDSHKDSLHRCGKCDRPLAIARRKGGTEVVLPVAVRRTISRDELSRPRSAKLPPSRAQTPSRDVPNFSRPVSSQSRISRVMVNGVPVIVSPASSHSDFRSMFPPPIPSHNALSTSPKDTHDPHNHNHNSHNNNNNHNKWPLTIAIAHPPALGTDGASSIVELPHMSPKSSKSAVSGSMYRSVSGSSRASGPPGLTRGHETESESTTEPSESEIFHSALPSPANFPLEPENEKPAFMERGLSDEMVTATVHAR